MMLHIQLAIWKQHEVVRLPTLKWEVMRIVRANQFDQGIATTLAGGRILPHTDYNS